MQKIPRNGDFCVITLSFLGGEMRSKALLATLFFLFLFCEPMIPAGIRSSFPGWEKIGGDRYRPAQKTLVTVTAYSSTPEQTDDSPFTMASGKRVYDGAVAANFLPIGTKVMLPELYGEKIFTVEDRTHKRFSDRVDVWMETEEEALRFGIKRIVLLIL